QLCSQPNFGGDCVTLEPGRYASLDPKVFHRAESARLLQNVASNDRAYANPNRADMRDYGYGYDRRGPREAAVELYVRPDFHGRAMTIDRNTPSLQGTDFDQRASSLVVNEGRWQACSDPGYQGYCRTFEPGRYEDLGRFNNQIGSLRRIG
ncbi:MAG: beta/gamma crystallin-related protein, partial [Bacillota bacterium]